MPDRRGFLAWSAATTFGAATGGVGAAPAGAATRLAAAWEGEGGYRVGLLSIAEPDGAALRIEVEIEVPTRAHGLAAEPGGTLLAVARRPGDWLMRWGADGALRQTHWIEPLRAFNGHLLASPDGRTLLTTETDLETGAGLIGVRDARSLRKRDEWPTHGIDPHELLWTPDGAALMVANGGVPTQPETGRVKRHLERMDSSLVRLDAASGRLQGRWRLADARLSLRHLAWSGAVLGIAVQAEHDAQQERALAPVLALFDGSRLRTVPAARPLAGYGGAIAAHAGGFAVGCPRAGGVALFAEDGRWRGWQGLEQACAVAAASQRLWAGGRDHVLGLLPVPQPSQAPRGAAAREAALPPGRPLRLDNHWINAS